MTSDGTLFAQIVGEKLFYWGQEKVGWLALFDINAEIIIQIQNQNKASKLLKRLTVFLQK